MYRQTEMFSDVGGGGHMPDAQQSEQLRAAFDVAAILYVSGGVLVRVMLDQG